MGTSIHDVEMEHFERIRGHAVERAAFHGEKGTRQPHSGRRKRRSKERSWRTVGRVRSGVPAHVHTSGHDGFSTTWCGKWQRGSQRAAGVQTAILEVRLAAMMSDDLPELTSQDLDEAMAAMH